HGAEHAHLRDDALELARVLRRVQRYVHLVRLRFEEALEHARLEEGEAVRRERTEHRALERREGLEDRLPLERLAAAEGDRADGPGRAAPGEGHEVGRRPRSVALRARGRRLLDVHDRQKLARAWNL